MKSALYWTALLVGIVIVVWIANRQTKVIEKFQESSASDTPVTVINELSDPATFTTRFVGYNTTLANNKVFAYLSAYTNKITRNNNQVDVYNSASSTWRDIVNGHDFSLRTLDNTTNIPTSLTDSSTNWKGLSLRGIGLIGPRSETMGSDYANNVFEVPSFSVACYMKWNSLNTPNDGDIVLFEMFAENPNYISWTISKSDSQNVIMKVVLGDANTVHKWTIPKSTLMSNGQPTLYTLTYDKANKLITIYVGLSSTFKKTLSSVVPILLANTPIRVNSNKNMDAVLSAFVMYKDLVLGGADIQKLNSYFMDKAGGADVVLAQAQSQINEATTQNQLLQSRLSDTEHTIADLQTRLQTCQASVPTESAAGYNKVNKYEKWSIKVDGADTDDLPTSDMAKCSALKISDFGDAKETSPLERQIPPELAANYTARKPFDNYDIRNPINPANSTAPIASATSAPPAASTSSTPSTTATSSSTTATSSSTTAASSSTTAASSSTTATTTTEENSSTDTVDAEFWRGLFNFVVNNQSQSQPTDRTQPGPGANLLPSNTNTTSSSSSASTTTSTPPPVREQSLWAFITDMF